MRATNDPPAAPGTLYGEDALPESVLFGCSPKMRAVLNAVKKVAATDVPVLILGESGTGKEIFARFIHRCSPRHLGPFVKVSCAAIPGQLLESELFGYQKGAFTGARTTTPGRIEMADQGTLFLDEIADLDANLQAKLLHVLQDGCFARIGDCQDRKANSRVICATNQDLEDQITNGRFRRDLFYRISVICIHLPPLRERRDDISMLADHFVALFNQRYERSAPALSLKAKEALREEDWHGNIRELENAVARYVLFGADEMLRSGLEQPRRYSPVVSITTDGAIPLKTISREAVREKECKVILKALEDNKWNRRRTAEMLKVSYRTLLYKIRKAGLRAKHQTHKTQNGADPMAGPLGHRPATGT